MIYTTIINKDAAQTLVHLRSIATSPGERGSAEQVRKLAHAIRRGAQFLVRVSDERTGRRYERHVLARNPKALCVRIGGTTYSHQLWAVSEIRERNGNIRRMA